MAAATRWQYWYWTYLAKPSADRAVYRLIEKIKPQRLVEFGMVSPQRTARLVQVSQRFAQQPLHYVGIDPFESRPSQDGITLKTAYRLLHDLGVKPQFYPGEPTQLVPLIANKLLGSDLVLVAPSISLAELATTWSFWPRMLHARSVVALWDAQRQVYRMETLAEMEQRALGATPFRRAA